MDITVQLFATLKERVGHPAVTLHVQPQSTVADLLDELVRQYPALTPNLSSLIVSVNQNFASRSSNIKAEDEIALFPPVSGG
jgi:molybdopterin converting factor subunit 1